jgi:hypothetical protein
MQTPFETIVWLIRAALTNGSFQAVAKEQQMNVLPNGMSPQTHMTVGDAVFPKWPVGKIDFNQPFNVKDTQFGNDISLGLGEVISFLDGASYPVVVKFTTEGGQRVAMFDTDGEDEDGNYEVEQVRVAPYQGFIVVIQDADGDLEVLPKVYLSRDAVTGDDDIIPDDIILVQEITVPAKSDGPVSDPVVAEVEEEEDGQAEAGAAAALGESAWINGFNRRVGETVTAWRSGFGSRPVEILRFRSHSFKKAFVDPKDGNKPYWAYDRNISS